MRASLWRRDAGMEERPEYSGRRSSHCGSWQWNFRAGGCWHHWSYRLSGNSGHDRCPHAYGLFRLAHRARRSIHPEWGSQDTGHCALCGKSAAQRFYHCAARWRNYQQRIRRSGCKTCHWTGIFPRKPYCGGTDVSVFCRQPRRSQPGFREKSPVVPETAAGEADFGCRKRLFCQRSERTGKIWLWFLKNHGHRRFLHTLRYTSPAAAQRRRIKGHHGHGPRTGKNRNSPCIHEWTDAEADCLWHRWNGARKFNEPGDSTAHRRKRLVPGSDLLSVWGSGSLWSGRNQEKTARIPQKTGTL